MKKSIITVLLLTPLVFMSTSLIQREPCACTTVNEDVVSILKDIDALLAKHASLNGGRYPQYSEFVSLLNASHTYAGAISPSLDPATGLFTESPRALGRMTFGYAVTENGRGYLLRGIGETNRFLSLSFAGHSIDIPLPSHYPVLTSTDRPPFPSPYR